MIQKINIFLICLFCSLFIISCEEPDDPALPYEASTAKSLGKTISSIDIFWEEAHLDNFDRYEIYFRKFYESDNKLYLTITNQNQVYATVSGLTPETEYKIFVVAVDKTGKVYQSKEVAEKTFSDVPSMIEKFYVSDYSYNRATLFWTEYKDAYAVPFEKYEVYIGASNDFICSDTSLIFSTQSENFHETTISSLADKKGYYFKLRVYNKLGKFRESYPVYLRTPNAPPKPVELLPPEQITESSAIIRWRKSTDVEFEKYNVYVDNATEQFEIKPANLLTIIQDASDTVITVSGLKKGSVYVYKVVVFDKYLDNAVSNYAGFHAYKNGEPPVCKILSIFPPEDKDEITITWEQSELKLFSRYDVYFSTDSLALLRNEGLTLSISDPEQTYATFKKLKSGIHYYFKIVVVDAFAKQSHSEIEGILKP